MELRIATRRSRLALWQAEHVAAGLRALGVSTELVPMSTRGDEILDRSLQAVGGKALFIKELEIAMSEGRADLAVHSMKDVPAELPDGFTLAAILEREDPHDALISAGGVGFQDLPQGARVGTSSLRRQAQLLRARPDLRVQPLRGNVETRLAKLADGELDAAVLACAGLTRLGLSERITELLDPEVCLPAAGQGAIGVECRDDASELRELLAQLDHPPTQLRVSAERAVAYGLGASCHVPVAAYATLAGEALTLRARVASPDGRELLEASCEVPATEGLIAGSALAEELMASGARDILAALED